MKRYLFIFNMIFITAAVYFSVNAFYHIAAVRLDHGPLAGIIHKEVSSPDNQTHRPFSNYKTIIDRNLFNTKTGATKKPKPVDLEALKQTELKLKLWGTVTGDGGRTYAVIEEKKERKQNLYRTGDTIQNATVKMILRQRVVLTVDGKDEILAMEEMLSRKTGRRIAKKATRQPVKRPKHARSIAIKRSVMENAVQNLNDLMKQVRIRPHFRDGKPDGLSLTGIRPSSIFRRMGLRNGDIIMGVDGEKIVSVDDALKFYKRLKSSSGMNLQIKRRGRLQTMNYQIE